MVDGKPYFVLGGELGNSSAPSTAYMPPVWPNWRAMHLDPEITPVCRQLLEPR